MKKFIYTILFAVVTSIAISSCTEEEVSPSTELNGGGGAEVDGKN